MRLSHLFNLTASNAKFFAKTSFQRFSKHVFVFSFSLLSLANSGWAQDLNRQVIMRSQIPNLNGQVKVAFFDADSTLRVSQSGSPSANGAKDYIILPGVAQKIAELNRNGYLVAIVSNQNGIPKYVSFDSANGALSNMIMELRTQGAFVDYFDFAENEDFNRKPDVGMGKKLEEKLKELGLTLDKNGSFMVGDSAYKRADLKKKTAAEKRPDGRDGFNFSNSDRLFAENFGIKFYEPQYFFDWIKSGVELIEKKEDLNKFKKDNKSSAARCDGLIG